MMNTVKVKAWGKDQGDHVIIDADKFDPKIHEEIGAKKQAGSSRSAGGKQTGGQAGTGERG